MSVELLPIALVVPTRNRARALRRMLGSLAAQSAQPEEVAIVDASDDDSTQSICSDDSVPGLRSQVSWRRALIAGAASQRNHGVRVCSQPVIGFVDDDILFEADCLARLWGALKSNERLGGVNAMITNQCYQSPGRISRLMFRIMAGQAQDSYAGKVLGPAINLLPEDRADLPEVVQVEWLNTGCTIYRREALPDPPFASHFTGYSLMEDLTLSVTVRRSWNLANVRSAKIFHDSQPGDHKSDGVALAEMRLVNRHYVMTRVLGRNRMRDYVKLGGFQCFCLASSLQTRSGRAELSATLRGTARGIRRIIGCR